MKKFSCLVNTYLFRRGCRFNVRRKPEARIIQPVEGRSRKITALFHEAVRRAFSHCKTDDYQFRAER
jgi:hypothetical protein